MKHLKINPFQRGIFDHLFDLIDETQMSKPPEETRHFNLRIYILTHELKDP